MDDMQMLREYVDGGSDAAFRALVERHVGLVHSVALRQVNDAQLAEEISQAVFILLSRKAGSLRSGVVLAGWLFRTTRFVAARALRAEQRRRRREQEAFDMQCSVTEDPTWKRIAPVLDSALETLGKKDREAVLLRFYQERNHQEVGAALGVSEDAARKRIARALERLRQHLARRGLLLTAASLASLLAANAVSAPPATLANAVAKAAAGASAPAASLPALVSETIAAWIWLKLKLAMLTLVIATAVVVPTVLIVTNRLADSRATMLLAGETAAGSDQADRTDTALETGSPSGASATEGSLRGAAPTVRGSVGALRLHVFARQSGEPVTNVSLAINTVTGGVWEQRYDLRTDANGAALIALPRDLGRLDVGVVSSGWATRFVHWRPSNEDPVPPEYILLLDAVTNTMGGSFRDEAGHTVAGVQVLLELPTGDASNREFGREDARFVAPVPVGISDESGRWSCAVIPGKHGGFTLTATHPDFAPAEIECGSTLNAEDDLRRDSFRQLCAGTLVTTLSGGITLPGRVLDVSGQPVAGAEVVHGPFGIKPKLVRADADGQFRFSGLASGYFDFTVTASGFAPEYREVTVERGMAPVDVQLKPAATLRLRVVDENEFDLAGITVGLEQWGKHRHVVKWSASTGPDGRVEWNSAPPDESLELYAVGSGWCYSREIRVKAGDDEHLIKMRRALVVDGVALDAESGELVSDVKAYPGYGEGEYAWERLATRRGTDGRFRVEFQENKDPWRVRVEAPGYLTATSEPLSNDFTGVLNIAMQPERSATNIAGTVLLPGGEPASGAEVALCTFEQMIGVTLAKGSFLRERGSASNIQIADRFGKFSFKPDPQAHTLVAVHPHGFARVRVDRNGQDQAIQLQRWGRIEGTVSDRSRFGKTAYAVLSDWAAGQYRGGIHLGSEFAASVDESGRFTFELAPPGDLFVSLRRRPDAETAGHTPVSVVPGETVEVRIGGSGVDVVGKFTAGEVETIPDWKEQTIVASLLPLERSPLPAPSGLNADSRKWWELNFWLSPAGQARLAASQTYRLWLEADGSFRGHDVLPGRYRLMIHVNERADTPLIGTVSYDFEVPGKGAEAARVLDLGTHPLKKPLIQATNPDQD